MISSPFNEKVYILTLLLCKLEDWTKVTNSQNLKLTLRARGFHEFSGRQIIWGTERSKVDSKKMELGLEVFLIPRP